MVTKLAQPAKAEEPRVITFSGITIDSRAIHPKNALSSIFSTAFGIEIDLKTLQLEKIEEGRISIHFGNVTFVNFLHSLNADEPIVNQNLVI
ncbi:MAG: hypothetical protein IJZ71_03375 [Treponema sp.]|nr:hypothetical protein [Treponema sp.]